MKDFLDKELSIGDDVVMIAPRYRALVKAKITAFTPKNVRVAFINDWNYHGGSQQTVLQCGSQMVKIDPPNE